MYDGFSKHANKCMHVLLKWEVWWVLPLRNVATYKLSICCSIPETIYVAYLDVDIHIRWSVDLIKVITHYSGCRSFRKYFLGHAKLLDLQFIISTFSKNCAGGMPFLLVFPCSATDAINSDEPTKHKV